ncbi:MAG TPA: ComEC/Rec2 family competence protein, partial [Cyanobium sp.]|nr:ComEC/Rec2 family competence protein [Cyanobium sp.]
RLLRGGQGPEVVRLRGQVLGDPQPPFCRVLLEGAGGRTELAFPSCPELRQGWVVAVEGRLSRPRPAPHPLLASAAERLARQGAWTRLRVERLEVLERPPTPIADLRRRIAGRLVAVGGAERGGLLAALVLGSAVVPLPDGLREAFRASGLSHALAASGFHLTVLLGAVMALGRGLGRGVRLTLAGTAIVLFLLLAGPQPSVVRAVLMGGVALVALESGRRGRPLGLLGLTVAVMLLLRPSWLLDVGFQLSVAATAGLVITASPLEQRLLAWLPGPLRRWLAPALAVPLAATLWTLPLQLLHFGALPLYAVPANLAATPLLTPLTLGAMGLALVALLAPPLLPLLALPVLLLAHPLLAIAHGFAALPMAQWQTGRPLPLLVLLLSLSLLGWVVPGLARRWRLWGTGLFALVVAVHLALLGGDRLLLVHQDSWGGAAPDGGGGRDLLVARTQGRGALIASHGDELSCAQARRLTAGLGVQRLDWLLLLDPVAPPDPACWRALAGVVVAYGEDGVPLQAGERLVSPGLAVEALSMDSHALTLTLAGRQWLLLPDRQALWAWQAQAQARTPGDGLWLGFAPRTRELHRLLAGSPRRVWLSGAVPPGQPLPPGWSASGASGSLVAG